MMKDIQKPSRVLLVGDVMLGRLVNDMLKEQPPIMPIANLSALISINRRHRSRTPFGEGSWPFVTLSRSEGSLALGIEMHRYAQHDSMVPHVASRGCHPEPQRRVSRAGYRDASLRSA
jgi:hypothetical protein